MTQSPQSGQAAPRTTEFGGVNPPHQAGSASSSDWSTPGYSGATTDPGGGANGAQHGGQQHGGQHAGGQHGGQQVSGQPNGNPQHGGPQHTSAPNLDRPAGQSDRRRATRPRGPRRARLQLRHIDPWTVLKFSCVLSIALFFVWLIVVGVLFGILDGAGIIGKINDTVTTLQGGNAQPPVTAGIVFGGAAIIGVVNIVLFIALSTVGSLVYNLCSDLVGGVEITLSER